MENSAYVPNSLPPPALVVFSQASGLPETLRMQRPFNPQATEAKDLHVPFTAASFGLRHMDGYSGLPAHLLHHLQPQFLHPALDPRIPFGSGAFRPLSTSVTSEAKGFASAFAPPAKCLKMETGGGNSSAAASHLSALFSPVVVGEERGYLNGQNQQRADSSSPASISVSPPLLQSAVKEETSDAPMSEDHEGTATPGSEVTERSTPEEGRGYRLGGAGAGHCGGPDALGVGLGFGFGPAAYGLGPGLPKSRCLLFEQGKKKQVADPPSCPVCGVTVRSGDLEAHWVHELERLCKLGQGQRARRPGGEASRGPALQSPADATTEGRWDTYQRIKANRQSRLRIKNRKRKAEEAICPVCTNRIQGSMEELNHHVEVCLRKQGGAPEEEENVDVEGDNEMFEEYEWAGQRRIRATTLLMGGFSGAGLQTCSSRPGPQDDDVDLVVDGDDTLAYGPPQYSESDVVVTSAEGPREEREREALRDAVISPDGNRPSPGGRDLDLDSDAKEQEEPSSTGGAGAGAGAAAAGDRSAPADSAADSRVLEALKLRIRELELESRASSDHKFKCLICMELYKKPVISICCWHVHCEECWLHTLGAKKLCPQCNMITSPADLRRIYM
ncbi:E3 ubiquitin-protein ligase Rnf220-like isoform X2 [Bacillus rossius redtenbacheri]|uniref:E3 ubiquitin-protein ligase Rnf220-like isoform X2 n=1 Tax=Bacillus rossius redtenbacheri TaxID=93214 RepID=UPI002FDE2E70